MDLLTRYIFKTVAIALIFVTACLTFAVWLTQILRFLELVVDAGAPAGVFFELLILTVPKFLELVLPIALLGSLLFIYNKLITDNEIVVMNAAGLSSTTLIKPVLILSGFLAIFMFILGGWLSPLSHAKLQSLKEYVQSQYSSVLLREGVFNSFNGDITVFVREKSDDNYLQGILIHQSTSAEQTTPSTIIAKEGHLLQENDSIKITLKNGSRQQKDSKTNYVSRLDFDNYTVDITPKKRALRERWAEPDERTLPELLTPDVTNVRDVRFYSAFISEFHRRISAPFLIFSFSLIAMTSLLIGGFDRRGQNKRILLAVLLAIIVQSSYLTFINLAASNSWFVIGIYASVILPIIFCWKMLHPKVKVQFNEKEIR